MSITVSSQLSKIQPKPVGKTSPHHITTINGVRCVVWVEEKATVYGEEIKLSHRATNEQFEELVNQVVQPLLSQRPTIEINGEITFQIHPKNVKWKTSNTETPTDLFNDSSISENNDIVKDARSHFFERISTVFQKFLSETQHVEEEEEITETQKKKAIPDKRSHSSQPNKNSEDHAAVHTYKSIDQNLRDTKSTLTSETVAHSLAVIQQNQQSDVQLVFTKKGSCLETTDLSTVGLKKQNIDTSKEIYIPNIDTSKEIYIPIRIGEPDHFVTLFITKDKQVRFYDPLGEKLRNRYPELATAIDDFLTLNFPHNTPAVTEPSSDLLQSDKINCGAFVIREYHRKCDDSIPFEPGKIINRNPKSLIESYRKDLAETISKSRKALASVKKQQDAPAVVELKKADAPKIRQLADTSPQLQVAEGVDLIRVIEENLYKIQFTDQPLLVCSSKTNRVLSDDPYTPLAEINCRTNLSGYDIHGHVMANILHQKAGHHYAPAQGNQQQVNILLVPTMPQSIKKMDEDTKSEIENSLYSTLLHAKEKKNKHLVIALPKIEAKENRAQVIEQLAKSCYDMTTIEEFHDQFEKILFVVDGNGQADDRAFLTAIRGQGAQIYDRSSAEESD